MVIRRVLPAQDCDDQNGDVWWSVIYNGALTEVHQDYFRGDVLCSSR